MKNLFLLLFFGLIVASGAGASDLSAKAVMATVNGVAITRSLVEAEVRRLVPRTLFHQSIDAEKLAAFRKDALESLIDKELRVQEAARLGLTVDKRAVGTELKKVIERYSNKREFEKRLKAAGYSTRDAKEEIERRLLADLVFQREVVARVKVSDQEARSYYEANQEKFVEPRRFNLSHILVKVPPLANDFEEKALEKKAKEIARQIRAGLTFDEAVRKYAEGDDQDDGGDMGWVHEGRLVPEIEQEIAKLTPGEIAGPFRTFRGFRIFRVDEVRTERQVPFPEIRDKLLADLTEKAIQERETVWKAGLREKAEIVRHELPAGN